MKSHLLAHTHTRRSHFPTEGSSPKDVTAIVVCRLRANRACVCPSDVKPSAHPTAGRKAVRGRRSLANRIPCADSEAAAAERWTHESRRVRLRTKTFVSCLSCCWVVVFFSPPSLFPLLAPLSCAASPVCFFSSSLIYS